MDSHYTPSDPDIVIEPLPSPEAEVEAALTELARIILTHYQHPTPLPDSVGTLESGTGIS